MALDTLEIYGTEFTGVAGIKATDDNNQTKTYIRPQGTLSITSSGNYDVTNYASADVSISGGSVSLQSTTVTPTQSQINVTAGSGYDGLSTVTVNAISNTYVGSGITTRNSSSLTSNGATVTAPAGYYSANATKAITAGTAQTPPTTLTRNPTISVSSGGLITATVSTSSATNITPNVTAGYISSGTQGEVRVNGSNTSQMTVKAATTYTPTTSDQTISSGTYLTGNQIIQGDTNLVAGNIKSGTSIFGITGSYTGGGGATNFLAGTFLSSSTTGAAQTVNLPYTGSGYIVSAMIFVTGGAYNSSDTNWYTSKQRYAIGQWTVSKSQTSSAPTYSTSGVANQGVTAWIYKNSTSSNTCYSRSSAMNTNTFSGSSPASSGATAIRFSDNKTMKVYVASNSYGLLKNTNYTYHIVYSS